MFSFLKTKLDRRRTKSDALVLKKLLSDYDFELYLRDNRGVLFEVLPDFNFKHLLRHKSYFDGSIAEIIEKLSKERRALAIDVGANKGLTSVLLSKFCDRVIAFEPEAKNLKRIEKTLRLNDVKNVEVIPAAVSTTDGEETFFIAIGDAHHSLGKAHPGQSEQKTVTVPVHRLDTFCAERGIETIDILKVDVEGFETNVFDGASGLLKRKAIKNVIFEISLGVMERLGVDPYGPIRALNAHGYTVRDVNGSTVTPDSPMDTFGGQDLLATP